MNAVNQTELKVKNRHRILREILIGAPVSRSSLREKTGLSKMSVTNLVSELIEDGIVRETDKVKTPTGRNPVNLEPVPGCRHVLGLYISRDRLMACLCDLTGCQETSLSVPLQEETNETLLHKIFEAADTLQHRSNPQHLIGIGVACIGPLDRQNGVILSPPNFYQVQQLPLASQLSQRYGLPVFLDNDTNACAVAEQYFGQARRQKNFIFLGISNGIGAGVVVDGHLCGGANGLAGEVGHITVDLNGPRCSCGNTGCLELYTCIHQDFTTLPPAEKTHRTQQICHYLAAGCVTLANLFDPEVIYLGYRFPLLGEAALRYLRQEIAGRCIGGRFSQPRLALSSFGEEEPLYGAVSLCVDRLAL